MGLFTEQINNWDDWGNVFQSIPAFTPLIKQIFHQENLPLSEIKNLMPGTNAVFRVGDYVIKIFVPLELGADFIGTNIDVELFGMKLANAREVPAPKLIAHGVVEDKYCFKYIIMEYIHGVMLGEIESRLTYEEKIIIGQNIRKIIDKLNVQCENFTPVDVLQYAVHSNDWKDEGFPESFQGERLAYLANLHINEHEKVYCHGDLHCDNILVDEQLNTYIIDFADGMFAPAEYELAYVVSSLFCFEKPYMLGCFGDYSIQEIVDLCMTWLPIHAWGHATVEGNLKPVKEITSLAIMREKLFNLIKRKNTAR